MKYVFFPDLKLTYGSNKKIIRSFVLCTFLSAYVQYHILLDVSPAGKKIYDNRHGLMLLWFTDLMNVTIEVVGSVAP